MEIIQDIIPIANNRRGTPLVVQYITIHETGNSAAGADALMHNKYIRSQECINRPASWHFTVDDHSIYQHIPTNEQAIHAGTKAGNISSIGIELCINADGNFEQTKKNAQWLVADLLKEFELSLDKVKQHYDWSGKNCPATIRRTGKWNEFLNGIGVNMGYIAELELQVKVLTAEVEKQKGYVTTLRNALDAERRITKALTIEVETQSAKVLSLKKKIDDAKTALAD